MINKTPQKDSLITMTPQIKVMAKLTKRKSIVKKFKDDIMISLKKQKKIKTDMQKFIELIIRQNISTITIYNCFS